MRKWMIALCALICLMVPVKAAAAPEAQILFSESDEDLVKTIAMAEAGNQGPDGMWLVMSVVMNRVGSEDFPDTVSEVIYQKSQFSTVSNGSFDKVREYSKDCDEAFERIRDGDIAPMIIGFETVRSSVLDRYAQYVFTYRDHKFYVKKE